MLCDFSTSITAQFLYKTCWGAHAYLGDLTQDKKKQALDQESLIAIMVCACNDWM